jgi:hypothetical protein
LEIFLSNEDSMMINISWLTANSYKVHYVKMLVMKASEAEKMDTAVLNFGLNKFFEVATLEPCLILKNIGNDEIEEKVFKLRKKGFIWVDLNQCSEWNDKLRFELDLNSRLSKELSRVSRHKRVSSNKMDLSESSNVKEINSDLEALKNAQKDDILHKKS